MPSIKGALPESLMHVRGDEKRLDRPGLAAIQENAEEKKLTAEAEKLRFCNY